MIGFITIDEMSLEECYAFLKRETPESHKDYEKVSDQYEKLVGQVKGQEEKDYKSCRTIEDFTVFISKYSKMRPAYEPTHLDDARKAKARLENMAAEEEARKRQREQREAAERQRKRKIIVASVVGILLVAAVVTFFIGYRPVKTLSVEDMEFGKEGGSQIARLNTNVSSDALVLELPDGLSWVSIEKDEKMISVTATANPDSERSCVLVIKAYTTFFGNRIGDPQKTEIVIRQRSGYATKILLEKDLDFNQYGGNKRINIKTDGVKLLLAASEGWIKIIPKNQNHDGEFYHDDEYEVTVDENPDESRTGVIQVESGGQTREINISQASGYATELLTPDRLNFGKFGETKQIAVKTDGVSLRLVPTENWITCRRIRHDNNQKYYNDDIYEISVTANYSGNKTSKILVQTGGKEKEIIVGQTSGLAQKFSIDRSSIDYVDIKGTPSGRCFKVNVDTDGTSWSVSSKKSWIGVTKHDGHVEITVENNEGGSVRNGYVYLTSNNGHERKVEIIQDGNPTSFYPKYSSWTFDTYSDSKYISLTNNSHQSVYVSSDKTWLSAYMSGDDVKISCESNSNPSRDGVVTVSCGDKKTNIMVHQRGWITCYYCNNGYVNCNNYNATWTFDNWGNWGHGYVYFDGWGNRYVTPCERCGGTGMIICSKCGGNGKIKTE